jgi:hypothetical protein
MTIFTELIPLSDSPFSKSEKCKVHTVSLHKSVVVGPYDCSGSAV